MGNFSGRKVSWITQFRGNPRKFSLCIQNFITGKWSLKFPDLVVGVAMHVHQGAHVKVITVC